MSEERKPHRAPRRLASTPTPPAPLETLVRDALARDEVREAVTSTLELYGPEVFGFIAGVVEQADDARRVYLRFVERLWEIVRFRWHCSLRTWCYGVARSEIARHRIEAGGVAPLPARQSEAGAIDSAPPGVWARGQATRRDGIAVLRAELAPSDFEILALHVGRGMSWRDVALTTLGPAPDSELRRESRQLRLRFAAIKEQVTKAAAAYGITPRSEQSDGNIEVADPSPARLLDLRARGGDR